MQLPQLLARHSFVVAVFWRLTGPMLLPVRSLESVENDTDLCREGAKIICHGLRIGGITTASGKSQPLVEKMGQSLAVASEILHHNSRPANEQQLWYSRRRNLRRARGRLAVRSLLATSMNLALKRQLPPKERRLPWELAWKDHSVLAQQHL